jgi:lysozyme family protein
MQYPFDALQPAYQSALARMQITRLAAVKATAERLVGFIDAGRYDAGCRATGVNVAWAAASFEREASSRFNLNPAQGWPLDSQSKWVPHNGPFKDWTTAQVAAYDIDGLDKVGAANWTWERGCYEGEAFNGWGYRSHGIRSPYLWAGTSLYTDGKYVADGVWSATEVDQQLGIVPMMYAIVQLRPQLAMADAFPQAIPSPPIVPAPAPIPVGHQDAAALHDALNKLLALEPPFPANDNNYDRFTRAAVIAFQKKAGFTGNDVDGLAGPKTWTAINDRLAALPQGATT